MQKFQTNVTLAALAAWALSACGSAPSSYGTNSQSGYSGGQGPLAAQTTTAGRQAAGSDSRTQQSAAEPGRSGSMKGAGQSSMGSMKGMDHASTAGKVGMDHSTMSATHDMSHAQHGAGAGHGASTAGKPGSGANTVRTVPVVALDTMRFEPSTLRVLAGETIRFVVTNKGKLPHEFVIGTVQEQKQHEEMMQKMQGMKHEDTNAVSLAPGETRTLVWQFGQSNDVQIGCHVPGHYSAGMLSKVTVVSGSK